MTRPAPVRPVPLCTCGQPMADHLDGTGGCQRCDCPAYAEMCPRCRHARTTHNGLNGQCTRIVARTKEPCGCPYYIGPATP